jgi:hypothetical protein
VAHPVHLGARPFIFGVFPRLIADRCTAIVPRMRNRPLLALVAASAASAALAAGCGSSSSSSSSISGDDAKAAVEKAAAIHLASTAVPGDAKKQGLTAAYSNASTAAADKQFVFVFTMKDAGTLSKLKGQLKDSLPSGSAASVVTHENVMVVYGAIGSDHLAAVKSAVNAL